MTRTVKEGIVAETATSATRRTRKMSEREIIPRHNGKSMTDILHLFGADADFAEFRMDDLISRAEAIKRIEGLVATRSVCLSREECDGMRSMKERAINAVKDLPTAEPREGEWLMVEDADEDGNAKYECSLCHAGETHTPKVKVSYCWNCGAKMEE